MKTSTVVLFALFQMIHPLFATPDHAVSVTERFLGSNATEFAIIRVETDNLSSYYSSRVSTWLDEIPKTSEGREKMKSTLLLDVTRTVDVDHSDQNTPPPVAEKINSQDASLILASVLQSYPGQMRQSWTPEQLAKLEVHPVGGVHFNRKLSLVHGTFVHEKLFGGRHVDEAWSLSEVSEDADCIYLRLSSGIDSGPESRIVCVTPEVTKQQRDQASAQQVYLVAGNFESRDEAMQTARSIMVKARELKLHGFELEIWSLEDGTMKTKYVIADQSSTYRIGIGGIPEIEKALEIRLRPMSSSRFIEKFVVTN
ncbi:MAG: hypothetical protein V4640_00055 [Verrucomicrobiota bacterium]